MKNHPLILFDGVCNLCNATVDFIIKRKSKTLFLFASLQSEIGEKLVQKYNIPPETDSVILIHNDEVFMESEAALEIVRLLPFPWNMLAGFRMIPKKWRNQIYRWVSQNRYRWFGKRATCRLPAPEEKRLFPEISDLNF